MRRIIRRATRVLGPGGGASVHRSGAAPRHSMLVTWFAVVAVGLAGSVSAARAATPERSASSASSAFTPSDDNPGEIAVGCCQQSPRPEQPICDRGDTRVAYNDMPLGVVNCLNPAEGFECCQTNEFGDEVILAGNATIPGRSLRSLRVLFASFACQSGRWHDGACQSASGSTFTHPITANIYDPAGLGGLTTPIATLTQTMTIPYRPSADAVRCPVPGTESVPGFFFGATAANRWFNATAPNGGACQNAIAAVLTFTGFGTVTLPDTIVWTVAFNTTSSGYQPIGPAPCSATSGGCPYDSLNVGTKNYPGAPYAGTDPDEDQVFVSRGQPPSPLHAESGWFGFRPLGEVLTRPPALIAIP